MKKTTNLIFYFFLLAWNLYPASSYDILIGLADSFDLHSLEGRRGCWNATAAWYRNNSIWHHLDRRGRMRAALALFDEKVDEWRMKGFV